MSQDYTPELAAWNSDRSNRKLGNRIYFSGADGRPTGCFEYNPKPAPCVRPFHLTIFQYPCAHFFSVSDRVVNALMRVFYEP